MVIIHLKPGWSFRHGHPSWAPGFFHRVSARKVSLGKWLCLIPVIGGVVAWQRAWGWLVVNRKSHTTMGKS